MTVTIGIWQDTIGAGTNHDAIVGDLSRRMDLDTEYEEARERRTMQRFGFLAVAVVCAALWLASILSGSPFVAFRSLVPFALCLASVVIALGLHFDTPRRLRQVRSKGGQRKSAAIKTLHAAIERHADLVRRWKDRLRDADTLRDAVRAFELPELVEDAGLPETKPADHRPTTVARSQGQPAMLPSWDLKPSAW